MSSGAFSGYEPFFKRTPSVPIVPSNDPHDKVGTGFEVLPFSIWESFHCRSGCSKHIIIAELSEGVGKTDKNLIMRVHLCNHQEGDETHGQSQYTQCFDQAVRRW